MSADATRVFLVVLGIYAFSGGGCSSERRASEDGGPTSDAGEDASIEPGGGDAGGNAGDDASAPGAEVPSSFDAWREVQAVLRTQPDHREARAEALVAQRDPEQLFLFVRDQIATYPSTASGFGSALIRQRWGVRGTLRGGAGTPREKAELLVSLYERAGFEAEVVRGAPDPDCLTGESILLGARPSQEPPMFSEEQTGRWRRALGAEQPKRRRLIDPSGERAEALSQFLLEQLPADLTAPFDFRLTDIPRVRVKVGEDWVFANPLAKSAPFGTSCITGNTRTIAAPSAVPEVLVRVSAARADTPYERFTLVERIYETEEVVGRKINFSFVPPVPTETLLGMRVDQATAFVPLLAVAGPNMTQEERDALAASGDVITLQGDRYTVDEASGVVSVNGRPLDPGTSDPAQVARVATISASTKASAFPSVTLRLSALDKDGATVPGLAADAFKITEGGSPVPFQVVQNQSPPPRVVLLFDLSNSVPPEFNGANAQALAEDIFSALYAAHPGAQARVASIGYGANFATAGWATSLAEANAQAAVLPGVTFPSSEIWKALYEVAAVDPTLVVLISDCDPTDELLSKYRNAIASGPPVVTLGVGSPVQQDIADQITNLSQGAYFGVSNRAEALDAVLSRISARSLQDYEVRYQAPREGPATRTVRVELNGKVFQATYDVPATPAIPPALSGLYLTLRVNDREYTRALAGFHRGPTNPNADVDVTSEMLEDVRGVLLGRVSIAVEAAPPSPSTLLDDWITDKLSLEPLWSAVESQDAARVLAQLKQGFSVTPGDLPLAQPPLYQEDPTTGLTFEDGLRVATLVQRARLNAPFRRELDLFPLVRFATATADAREAFERTVRSSARLAVLEAELMGSESTLDALEGVPLTLLNPGRADEQAGLTAEQRLQWAALEQPFNQSYQLLVPLAPGPFWAVDETTGSVIGILADGSGGGAGICNNYNAGNSMISAMGVLGSLAGASVGGWVALAKWEVRMITIATAEILGLGGGGGGIGFDPESITNPIAEAACGVLGDEIGRAFPVYSEYGVITGLFDSAGIDTGAPNVCTLAGLGMSGGKICSN